MILKHKKESGKCLLLLNKERYGIVSHHDLYEDSGLVEWAFKEVVADLIRLKHIVRFTNMYDTTVNYYQITPKGDDFLLKSVRKGMIQRKKK